MAGPGAVDPRLAGGQFLLAPLHFELVRLGHFQGPARVLHLPGGGIHNFGPGPGLHQRIALLGLLESGCGGFPAVAILIVLLGGNIVVLIKRLGALPIALGAVELRLRGLHGRARLLYFLRAGAVLQFQQSGFVRSQVGFLLLNVRGQRGLLPLQRRAGLGKLRFGRCQRRLLVFLCATNWSRSRRATTCPIFTGSPSSTARSISRPAVLKAMLTSFNSMLPETRMRSSGVRPKPFL